MSRKIVVWISIPIILFGAWAALRYNYQRERADWKTLALARLGALSLTDDEISRELETLKTGRGAGEHQEWTGKHVLVMANNDYLVYESRHGSYYGFILPNVDALFLARGSDGRWYYSTFHFCTNMAMVRSEEPPGSLAEFAERYAVREFDGKSDVCLEHTWPENR